MLFFFFFAELVFDFYIKMDLANGSVNRQLLSHLGDKNIFLITRNHPTLTLLPPKVCGLMCAFGHCY